MSIHPARLAYLATQLAPGRKIESVALAADGGPTVLKLECGHTPSMAQHFHYTPGSSVVCHACGEVAAANCAEAV